MKKTFVITVSAILLSVSVTALAATDLKGAMTRQLAFTQELFDSIYAPADWDRQHNGWDFAGQIADVNNWIQDTPNPSLKDFQRKLQALIYSAKDYHLSVSFNWTEKASLPFQVKSAEGHYLIAYVDRSQLPQARFPFQIGDEVVNFGGRPVADVVGEFRDRFGHNVEETDSALAEMALTRRAAAAGDVVPQGPISVEIKSAATGQISSATLNWNYTPEIVTPEDNLRNLEFHPSALPLADMSFHAQLVGLKMEATRFNLDKPQADNGFAIAGASSFLPDLGKIIWEAPMGPPYLRAYIYQSPNGKKIGYIRIPSYDTPNNEVIADLFSQCIQKLQIDSDALVIDEMNNPGGSLFFVYGLLSHLAIEPLAVPHHLIKLTQDQVVQAQGALDELKQINNDSDAQNAIGKTLDGYPVSYDNLIPTMRAYYENIISTWQSGRNMTDAVAFQVDKLMPQTNAQYTKPILVLTNELDFSGADFFPAILQDNHRATIMGVRTSGAGGIVTSINFPNQLGIRDINMTITIAERLNNQPIESLGVKPDISYSLKVSDFRNNFAGYVSAINQAAEGLLK